MPRRTKYTPETIKIIIDLLEQGNTDHDAYSLAGISTDTFYQWIKAKSEFSEAVTQARSKARRAAVASWRQGMLPSKQIIETIEKTSETRLRKDKDGNEIPYTHTREVTKHQTINNPADWRAAEAYLKRRDPENWSEMNKVGITGENGGPIKITVVYTDKSANKDVDVNA